MSVFISAVKKKIIPTVQFVSAGGGYSLALYSTGKAWAWGSGTSGQLGNNSTTSRNTPVSVAGAAKVFCFISAGFNHSLALDRDGKGWAWGSNSFGWLGTNNTTGYSTPVAVITSTPRTFCKIDAGIYHSAAIDKNGAAWGWGWNRSGELGDNTKTQRNTPVTIVTATAKTFCQISSGNDYTMAIDKDGKAWGWGNNGFGGLGTNNKTGYCTPVAVVTTAPKTFCKISAGGSHTLAIDKNGKAWTWGVNTFGQLGDNSATDRCTPVAVCGNKTFCQISAGDSHSTAIDKNGRAWAWGLNTSGQLGNNSFSNYCTPVSVCGTIKTFCEISAGQTHTLARDNNGKAWAWGDNTNGKLGANLPLLFITPVSVVGTAKTFCHISAARSGTTNNNSTGIDKNGKAYSWGYNNNGQLGVNDKINYCTPIAVYGTKTFCKISTGPDYSLVIDKNGKGWAWGLNTNGKLGTNNTTAYCTPFAIYGTKTFCQISAGNNHSLAIDKNGKGWAWGYNEYGKLGNNSTTDRCTPFAIYGTKTFCAISAGNQHSLAIDKDGKAWAWGVNFNGRLGDNSTTSRLTPVAVCGNKTFCVINSGTDYSLAIDKNGKAWAWGINSFGNLGDGSTTQRITPVAVCGNKTFCAISGGVNHTLAIDKNGKGWAWGLNSSGELGINSTSAPRTPFAIYGNKTFCKISAGTNFSLAVDNYGKTWAWGSVTVGQLGNNLSQYVKTPVMVCNI